MHNLDVSALLELGEQVTKRFCQNSEHILTKLNRTGKLLDFLRLVEMQDLLGEPENKWAFEGKIIVIGASDVKKENLIGVAKSLGISKQRLEFCLDYEDAKTYDFKKTQYKYDLYACILAGPMPHKGKATGGYSSILTALESQDGYPPVERMGLDNLKISKSSFEASLRKMIQEGYVIPNM